MHAKNGIKTLGVSPDDLFNEMKALGKNGMDYQYKCYRTNKIKSKHARWNFNVGDRHQDPDIEKGKNTLYNFHELPFLNIIRKGFNNLADLTKIESLRDLLAEANVY